MGFVIQADNRAGWTAIWPFTLLCLLGASRWLLEATWPSTVSSYRTQVIGCAGAASLVLISFVHNRMNTPGSKLCLQPGRTGLLGVVVLAGPAVATLVAGRFVSGSSASLAMALSPVVVAVAMTALGALGQDLPARLWPGLTGLAGLLLLLPQPDLSPRFLLALSVMPVSAGLASAFVDRGLSHAREGGDRKGRPRSWMAVALLGAAVVYGGLAFQGWRESARHFPWSACVLDGLGAFLSLQVLETLGAMRWCAQFLVTPLLTLLEGVVFLHPLLDLRSWLAFGLLLVSSAYLLWNRTAETEPVRL